ncbi:hypothetical protein JMJ76_0011504 [Colletotrichum scovillei]|nr:hypothetical protein JMJ76_0011504 [Colletotrichum scovillei]KAG7082163.1 hypothetical protein JMJ78_0004267 [Colletotrichum scovillei]
MDRVTPGCPTYPKMSLGTLRWREGWSRIQRKCGDKAWGSWECVTNFELPRKRLLTGKMDASEAFHQILAPSISGEGISRNARPHCEI